MRKWRQGEYKTIPEKALPEGTRERKMQEGSVGVRVGLGFCAQLQLFVHVRGNERRGEENDDEVQGRFRVEGGNEGDPRRGEDNREPGVCSKTYSFPPD